MDRKKTSFPKSILFGIVEVAIFLSVWYIGALNYDKLLCGTKDRSPESCYLAFGVP